MRDEQEEKRNLKRDIKEMGLHIAGIGSKTYPTLPHRPKDMLHWMEDLEADEDEEE